MNKLKPSFEESIKAASIWCSAWDQGELSDEVLAERVSELLDTSNGARGFFAISLSSNSPLMDRLPEALIFQLREAGELVVDLVAKNLAMSTAMALHHQRNKNFEQQVGSQNITRRCLELLRVLEPFSVKKVLESLLEATQGKGKYDDFLNRWNYDDAQKLKIAEVINLITEN